MLLAEIHGKRLDAARDDEDYMTSAVFGHLRFVPPGPFWQELFRRVRGLPGTSGEEPSMGQVLADAGRFPSGYSQLKIHFWKEHPKHGQPDLIMVFTADGLPPLVVLVEIKLWSPKGGSGDDDQLVRYFRLLEALPDLDLPSDGSRYLVYLTPREAREEVQESAARVDDPERDPPRLFRLQWQDVLEAAEGTADRHPEPCKSLLSEVAEFLRRVGLEYFKGFRRDPALPWIDVRPAPFSTSGPIRFQGFRRVGMLPMIEIQKARWAK